MVYISCGTYLFSWIAASVVYLLINIPIFVIQYFQVWRIITAPFVSISLLGLLFSMLSYLPTAGRNERRLGTARYVAFFMINFTILESTYTILLYALSFIPNFSMLSMSYTAGLWPLIMVEMVIRCNIDPDALTSLFLCPIQIKAKYMPWAFLLLFSLFAGVLWDLLIGVLIGYLHVYKRLEFTLISDQKAKALESSFMLGWLTKITNFVSLANAGSEDTLPIGQQQGSSLNSFQQPNVQVQRSQPFVPFAGQGYKLGGDDSAPKRHKLTEVEDLKEDDPLV